jgi:hypothetical protein
MADGSLDRLTGFIPKPIDLRSAPVDGLHCRRNGGQKTDAGITKKTGSDFRIGGAGRRRHARFPTKAQARAATRPPRRLEAAIGPDRPGLPMFSDGSTIVK